MLSHDLCLGHAVRFLPLRHSSLAVIVVGSSLVVLQCLPRVRCVSWRRSSRGCRVSTSVAWMLVCSSIIASVLLVATIATIVVSPWRSCRRAVAPIACWRTVSHGRSIATICSRGRAWVPSTIRRVSSRRPIAATVVRIWVGWAVRSRSWAGNIHGILCCISSVDNFSYHSLGLSHASRVSSDAHLARVLALINLDASTRVLLQALDSLPTSADYTSHHLLWAVHGETLSTDA
mmetsp:Transcript_3319/g.6203  ORF Transcript_3319/g.6203 Transcript_3319/m.6203 type:complete len:233 (-) Transcript_3319:837-1535(-)